MGRLIIAVIFILIGAIVVLPLYLLAKHEKNTNSNYFYLHLFGNVIFMTWSIYDIEYGFHYAHGPNSLFLIIPALPALMIFYAFIYPKVITYNKSIMLSHILAGLYLVASIIGVILVF